MPLAHLRPGEIVPALIIGTGRRSFIYGFGPEHTFFVQFNTDYMCQAMAGIRDKSIFKDLRGRMRERVINEEFQYKGEIIHETQSS